MLLPRSASLLTWLEGLRLDGLMWGECGTRRVWTRFWVSRGD